MASNTKEVKQRLNSIKNTRKITKAMEMVSAAKMRKAVASALSTRAYHAIAWGIVNRIRDAAAPMNENDPVKRFFDAPKQRLSVIKTSARQVEHAKALRTVIVAFTSNRGLCGSFNSNIARLVQKYKNEHPREVITLFSIGNRGTAIFSSLRMTVEMAMRKLDTASSDEAIMETADILYKKFLNNETDKIMVAYADWRSAISQDPVIKRLFPFKGEKELGLGKDDTGRIAEKTEQPPRNVDYLYEPSQAELLERLIPRIAHVQLYQALLESNASEHSSRMVAMKNASEAADEMLGELVLEFNKARQAGITREIAEISAGRAAVS